MLRETFFLKIIHKMWWINYIPKSFSKKSRLINLWVNSLKFYTVCFYSMSS